MTSRIAITGWAVCYIFCKRPGNAIMPWSVLTGDARKVLPRLRPESISTCVCSPPYFGLRDYGVDGQIGTERTPEEYIGNLSEVFEGVRRVLRDDGTLWIVIGDSYAARGGDHSRYAAKNQHGVGARRVHANGGGDRGVRCPPKGTKPIATFPPDLVEPMVLAGAPEGGTVLDPFAGSGTTGVVAVGHGRSFVGIELNPEYAEMSRERLKKAWAEKMK